MGAPLGNTAQLALGVLPMKIEIVLDNAEKVVIYGMSPLDFAQALNTAHYYGDLEFQTKETIENAVREHNKMRCIA